MSKIILISGGSGLVGSALTDLLENQGHEVRWLTRNIDRKIDRKQFRWDVNAAEIDSTCVENVDIIIHLAGASIGEKRWTPTVLKNIRDSRIESAKLIYQACKEQNHFPNHYISGSAIGYYGFDRPNEWLDEDASHGDDHIAVLVRDWEDSANRFANHGAKLTWLRTGIVLTKNEGAFAKMLTPIKWGVGSPLGPGNQIMSWIHMEDEVQAIKHIIDQELEGIFNLTAPQPASNRALTKAIAKQIKVPLLLPNVPSFVLKLVVGDFYKSVIGSIQCSSKKLEDTGFNYKFPEISGAVDAIFNQ